MLWSEKRSCEKPSRKEEERSASEVTRSTCDGKTSREAKMSPDANTPWYIVHIEGSKIVEPMGAVRFVRSRKKIQVSRIDSSTTARIIVIANNSRICAAAKKKINRMQPPGL